MDALIKSLRPGKAPDVKAPDVKAPDVLKNLDGLETNRLNQLIVTPTLQATRDENIFVIGDCAACAWDGKPGQNVPPRAQAAHQQATHAFKQSSDGWRAGLSRLGITGISARLCRSVSIRRSEA